MDRNYSLEEVLEIRQFSSQSYSLERKVEKLESDSPVEALDEIAPLREEIKEIISKMVTYPEVFSKEIEFYSSFLLFLDNETRGYLDRVRINFRDKEYTQNEFNYIENTSKERETDFPEQKPEESLDDDLPF